VGIELKYRDAEASDCQTIYGWINDPVARQNSFSTELIPYESHESWFMARILQKENPYLVFYPDASPDKIIGQVRVEVKPEGLLVGIVLAPDWRGKGLASVMLQKAALHVRTILKSTVPLLAMIKQQNKASIKVFEQAGFIKKDTVIISDTPSYIYEKKI